MTRRLRLVFPVLVVRKYLWASALVLVLWTTPRLQGQQQVVPDESGFQPVTINDYFAEIGRRAPGFGGIFVDEGKDTIYVYMVNGGPDSQALVDKALTDVLGSDRPAQNRLELLPGNYTFLQLKEWHDKTSMKLLAIPGALQTGIDHWTNRLKIGVEDLSITPQVEAVLAESGVPREAVNVEQMSPYQEQIPSEPMGSGSEVAPLSGSIASRASDEQDAPICIPNTPNTPCTLQSYIRPLVGGIQIEGACLNKDKCKVLNEDFFEKNKFVVLYDCTLGFIARLGISKKLPTGFVTGSHCTAIQGGSEDTLFFQPVVTVGGALQGKNLVAREFPNGETLKDPKGDPCYWDSAGKAYPANCTPKPGDLGEFPCPEGEHCRRSDSSFSSLFSIDDNTPPSNLGYIARPSVMSQTPCQVPGTPGWIPPRPPCDLDWIGAPRPNYFRIVASSGIVMPGQTVNKVGRSSGWTQGIVTEVCVNFTSIETASQYTELCQNKENFMQWPGDSGAPVFVITNELQTNDVKIVGIVIAGNCEIHHNLLLGSFSGCGFFGFSSPIGTFSPISNMQDPIHELGPLNKCGLGRSC